MKTLEVRKNTISAHLIAKYFLWKASQEGKTLTNKKLQKLLYYAQAWNLAIEDNPLFTEKIEAWIHGPAIRSIWEQYKVFGFGSITEAVDSGVKDDVKNNKIIDEVWRVYGKYDADYLEELTHNELPWQEARGDIESKTISDNEISLETMKTYYRKRLTDARKEEAKKIDL
ncbi:MAG: type II toxin-antitoxin system antitoxin SocA domain-containing protein [Candidatus Berkelbacteria bacterium]